jgi:hypothetical protein
MSSLKVLGFPVADAAIGWIYISKLDPETEKEWVKSLSDPSKHQDLVVLNTFF